MARFYIATGFENKTQHNHMRDALVELGHTITHDWTAEEDGEEPEWEEIANDEMLGAASADFGVMILPGVRGTHTELGIALANDIPVFLLSLQSFKDDVPFYHLPKVIRVPVQTLYGVDPQRERLLLRDAAIQIQGLWLRDHAK